MAQQQAPPGSAWAPPRLQFVPISLDEDLDERRGGSGGSGQESDLDDDATPVVNEQTAWNHAQRLPFAHYDASVAASSVASEHDDAGNYSPITDVIQPVNTISDSDLNDLSDALQRVYEEVTLTAQQQFLQLKQRLLKDKEAVVQQRDQLFLEHSKRYHTQLQELQEQLERSTQQYFTLAERYEHVCVQLAASRATLKRLSTRRACYETALAMWRDYQQRRQRFRRNDHLSKRIHTRRCLARAFARLKNTAHRTAMKKQAQKSEEQLHAVSKELIDRYETRIRELASQLSASEARCLAVQRSRAQLEEDLRRTFLKGMSVMNLEALSLFNASKRALHSQQLATQTPAHQHEQPTGSGKNRSSNSDHEKKDNGDENDGDDDEEIPRQQPPPMPSNK